MNLNGGLVIVTGGVGLLGQQYCKAIKQINGVPLSFDIKNPDSSEYVMGMDYWHCDITNKEELLKCLNLIKTRDFPNTPIVGLINNAAIDPKFEKDSKTTPKSRLEALPLEQWHKEIEVGLTGAFLCTQVFGAEMARNGKGSIINVSSVLGQVAPNQSLYHNPELTEEMQNVKPVTYSVIKAGIIGLTKYTATYWANKGIRCNAICPAGVFNNHSDEFVAKLSKYIPLGRMAKKDEYNELIKFLLTDASSYMTGSVIPIDGGMTAW